MVWTEGERERGGSGWLPLGLAFLAGALAVAVAQRYFPELLGGDAAPHRPPISRPASRAEAGRLQLSWDPASRAAPPPESRPF